MVTTSKNIKLGQMGINYIKTIVDENICNFHIFAQENDVGIDGQIELFDENNVPTGQLVSVQVKTGRSFYNPKKLECTIPIGTHKDYWMNIELPVIGIVCIMNETYESVCSAYWIDIKEYLLVNPTATNIKFKMAKYNEFNKMNFRKYFYPLITDRLPTLSFEEAVELITGEAEDKLLGVNILQTKFSHEVRAWEILFSLYENGNQTINYSTFFESISYAFPHPNHWHQEGIHSFSNESAVYVKRKVELFSTHDIINILRMIKNHFFERGTMGQTAEIIIREIKCSDQKLLNIILDANIDSEIRSDAEAILAYQNKNFYLENINQIKTMHSEFTDLLLQYFEEFGEYDLY